MARLHPNVLKSRKQRREKGRRAYLTSQYSLISVPRSVGTSGIPEDAKALFDYRSRGKTSAYDPFLDAIFPGVTPKASEWKSINLHKYLDVDGNPIIDTAISPHNGRKFTLERSEEEKLIALIEDPDVCDYVTLRTSILQKKRMTFVFNRKHDRCFFIEITYDESNSFCMKSKVYGSKERAMFDFEHHRISWMEFLELSSLALVLPRRA